MGCCLHKVVTSDYCMLGQRWKLLLSLPWVAEGDGNSFSLETGFTPVGSGVRPCGETFSGITFGQVWGRALLALQLQTWGGPGLGARLLSSNPSSATCQLCDLGGLFALSVPSVSHLSNGLSLGLLRDHEYPCQADRSEPGRESSANTGGGDAPETSAC